MTYATSIFSISAATERFIVRAFGVTVWAIAIATLAFINACINSYELGKDARSLWESTGHDYCAAEIAPCVAAVSAVVAWFVDDEQCWSYQRFPGMLAANSEFLSEVKADYLAVGASVNRFIENNFLGV